jgi:hypothetical protein
MDEDTFSSVLALLRAGYSISHFIMVYAANFSSAGIPAPPSES